MTGFETTVKPFTHDRTSTFKPVAQKLAITVIQAQLKPSASGMMQALNRFAQTPLLDSPFLASPH